MPSESPPAEPSHKLSVLRWIIGFTLLSTAAHFTHNFVRIEDYPQSSAISNTLVQVGIVLAWPVLTAIGLYGYRLYSQGRHSQAHVCLLAYSALGLATLGHFTVGKLELPAFWFATILTDGLAGLALVGFVAWSASALRTRSSPLADAAG